jgi:hypothetical protein
LEQGHAPNDLHEGIVSIGRREPVPVLREPLLALEHAADRRV